MKDLRAEVESMFAGLVAGIDPDERIGFSLHPHLRIMRATIDGSRPGQTEEQRREKRRALEARRREYKAAKAREYYAARGRPGRTPRPVAA